MLDVSDRTHLEQSTFNEPTMGLHRVTVYIHVCNKHHLLLLLLLFITTDKSRGRGKISLKGVSVSVYVFQRLILKLEDLKERGGIPFPVLPVGRERGYLRRGKWIGDERYVSARG